MSNHCIRDFARFCWVLFFFCIQTPSLACVGIQYQFEKTEVTVYYGETAWIPFTLYYNTLTGSKYWYLAPGLELRNISSNCPPIEHNRNNYGDGICQMALGVHGDAFINRQLRWGYHISDMRFKHYKCHREYPMPFLYVTVIPHPMSMNLIPDQQATAGIFFQKSLKNHVNYYDENKKAGYKPEIEINPHEANGLLWDPATLSIQGIPERIGHYQFEVSVKEARKKSQSIILRVEVQPNLKHKPLFKQKYSMPHAIPDKYYRFNLTQLLENDSQFGSSIPITFRVDTAKPHLNYMKVNALDPVFLEGIIPASMAGQSLSIGIIAHSNTGGDSVSQDLRIPVDYDGSKKPTIETFSIKTSAGQQFIKNIAPWIRHSEGDEVKLSILHSIPEAAWLHVSASDYRMLEGVVPDESAGKKYRITLVARSDIGGNSDPAEILLQINTNPNKTPRFRAGRPIMPLLAAGMPFEYDFSQDIFPGIEEHPFMVKFADPLSIPDWLKLENNTLFADGVPFNPAESLSLWVVIENETGGQSPPQKLELHQME